MCVCDSRRECVRTCKCVCVLVGVIQLKNVFSKPAIFPCGNLKTVTKFKLVFCGRE